jgi:methylated-DNA-[protein]-cysteine S-methyltransferase
MTELVYDLIESPLGTVIILCGDGAMRSLYFLDRKPDAAAGATRAHDPLGYSGRLEAYFDGDIEALQPIKTDPSGTPFQRLVWNALRAIPPGQTESYGTLAARIHKPSACRAVGLANGQNPISLVIPCHRVIGSNGSLTGYGGGLDRKKWLLEHEGALVAASQQSMKW